LDFYRAGIPAASYYLLYKIFTLTTLGPMSRPLRAKHGLTVEATVQKNLAALEKHQANSAKTSPPLVAPSSFPFP
jgi:hypothetical protein